MMGSQFDTIKETIVIAGNSYFINRIGDIDKLFDAFLAKGNAHADVQDEKIPYWAELWPSAIAMSQYILEHSSMLKGKKIIEIGAGLGLPSIVASKFAASVLCTDYIPESIDFAQANFKLNQIPDDVYTCEILDWRDCSHFTEKYDIIIASDVAYDRAAMEDLEKCIRHLSHSNTISLLSEPNRHMAVEFVKQLQENKNISATQEYMISLRNANSKVFVHEMKLFNS